jgi:hypothetical protein
VWARGVYPRFYARANNCTVLVCSSLNWEDGGEGRGLRYRNEKDPRKMFEPHPYPQPNPSPSPMRKGKKERETEPSDIRIPNHE